MKIIICDNYEEISEKAAQIVAGQVKENPKSVLGLATGSTPLGLYEKLAEMNKNKEISFRDVRTFNLDEYYPISDDNDQSYHYFMEKNLFSKIDIKKSNTHLLDGMCDNTDAECENYENMIEENGGIDLQILGIGQNGHIGFNEPNENLNLRTHLTDLKADTITANSRFFDDISQVPTRALTVGIGTILKARKIILIANGKSKHHAIMSLLTSSISTEIPASLLKVHTDVTLICDKEAYSTNTLGIDIGGTDIKLGVLSSDNKLIYNTSIPTNRDSSEALIQDLAKTCRGIINDYYVTGIGVGTPGKIKNGLVSAVNLPFKNIDLANVLEAIFKIPVKISNDGNCAALAEAVCGVAKTCKNTVMLSLGTGIGGGITIDGKIYEGCGSAGEIGHMPIVFGGRDCPCGEKGCFEQYASASALIKSAETAALKHSDSILSKLYKENDNKLNGVLFFKAIKSGCPAASSVLDEYTDYLAAGIKGLINIFDPDMIVLSGGITNAGDLLLNPLRKKIGSNDIVKISELKSNAGTIGAALLID